MMSSRKAPLSGGHEYAVGDAGCTRAWQFVVVSFFEAGQARVFSRSLS